MGKNLLNSLGAKLSQLKVMCGLSVDSAAKEEKAVAAVRRDPIPASRFLSVCKLKNHDQQLSTEFKVSGDLHQSVLSLSVSVCLCLSMSGVSFCLSLCLCLYLSVSLSSLSISVSA